MNTISQGFQKEAEEIITKNVVGNKDVKAVVFISSKSDNFIAGADIDMVILFHFHTFFIKFNNRLNHLKINQNLKMLQ